jgi:hypothetical protein
MREIAATQASVGLTPALFDALAETYAAIGATPAAAGAPEEVGEARLEDVLARVGVTAPGEARGTDSEEVPT